MMTQSLIYDVSELVRMHDDLTVDNERYKAKIKKASADPKFHKNDDELSGSYTQESYIDALLNLISANNILLEDINKQLKEKLHK